MNFLIESGSASASEVTGLLCQNLDGSLERSGCDEVILIYDDNPFSFQEREVFLSRILGPTRGNRKVTLFRVEQDIASAGEVFRSTNAIFFIVFTWIDLWTVEYRETLWEALHQRMRLSPHLTTAWVVTRSFLDVPDEHRSLYHHLFIRERGTPHAWHRSPEIKVPKSQVCCDRVHRPDAPHVCFFGDHSCMHSRSPLDLYLWPLYIACEKLLGSLHFILIFSICYEYLLPTIY